MQCMCIFRFKKIWLVYVEYCCAQKCNNNNFTKNVHISFIYDVFIDELKQFFFYMIIKFDELISQIAKIYKEGKYNLGMWAEYAL